MLWVSAFFSIELLARFQSMEAIDRHLDSTSLNELYSVRLVRYNQIRGNLQLGSDHR